jgi:5-formyltetrahydrofolate cyclo-ligase
MLASLAFMPAIIEAAMRYHRHMTCKPGAALRDAKQALRAGVLAARDALPHAVHAAGSQAIAQRLLALPEYAGAGVVILTLPFLSEWDVRHGVDAALAGGKRVALPRVDETVRMLALHAIADLGQDIEAGYRGIPEPRLSTPVVDPGEVGFALVPGVAFDPAGHRLGYGGGFYDRLLPLLQPATPRVAAAFDLQVVAHVPAGAHDVTIHRIVTPTRILECHAE